MDLNARLVLCIKADKWLEKNDERLTIQEKRKFKQDLLEFLNKKSDTIADEVYDFLVSENLIKNDSRYKQFAKYIKNKYPNIKNYSILDIGAGRMCHLSKELARTGANICAIDPEIRITPNEAKSMALKQILKINFECDKYAKNGKGTIILPYDLIVGLEPCMATEHIIRQGLKYDKPFDVSLCATNHNALNGKKFKSTEDWYKYLRSISSEIDIVEYKDSKIATNNKYFKATNEEEYNI